ncbi:PREDICTED: uncharacterized protein LOC104816302 [Tarenaya hassleriana]|uniref:uncharacterized protein LOC104816302 n=1 Tax=Tarenaya hassleriana TaxID=28532 RepID=UPI00053C2B19|nr:PREDICTED: uncharacterized protein LOC104816302 [Tarenaya hassleriana]
MLGKALASPLSTLDSAACLCISAAGLTVPTNVIPSNPSSYHGLFPGVTSSRNKWVICSTAQVETDNEDPKTWEECREALSCFSFSADETNKMLGKAFGHVHSPYWSEERKKETPKVETLNQTLDFLRSLGLTDDDLKKLLKKFPEVLGCSLEEEMKPNVQILEKDWGIKGKSLKSLLLRNPKVLGYNVDCKGDCMAQCTRCWVRF